MIERAGHPADPLFPTRTGRRLSRDAVAQRLNTHTTTATKRCPSLRDKDVHPHVLRHSCAMSLLQAGVDTSVMALWRGHANVHSTDSYVHADMSTVAILTIIVVAGFTSTIFLPGYPDCTRSRLAAGGVRQLERGH
jgi:site-specific recombinase XerD